MNFDTNLFTSFDTRLEDNSKINSLGISHGHFFDGSHSTKSIIKDNLILRGPVGVELGNITLTSYLYIIKKLLNKDIDFAVSENNKQLLLYLNSYKKEYMLNKYSFPLYLIRNYADTLARPTSLFLYLFPSPYPPCSMREVLINLKKLQY